MTFRACAAVWSFALWLAFASGCAGRTTEAEEPPVSAVFDLYPMQEGNAWSYDVDTGESATTLAVTRVESVDGRFAEVRTSESVIRYELRPNGIYVPAEEAWVIRAPLRIDETWPGRGGRTARVLSTTVTADTPAGTFRGCVEVLELGGRLELEVRTIYCPRVGPVSVASTMRSHVSERELTVSARLRGFRVSSNSGSPR